MTVVPIAPGTERGELFDRDLSICGAWPIPHHAIPMLAELIAAARRGVIVENLAAIYAITEQEAVTLCLHHRVGPKGGARYCMPTHRNFIEASQPPES